MFEPYARYTPQSEPQREGGETDQGAVKTEGGGEKGEEGKEATKVDCELRIHFTVRLIKEPSSIRPARTVRLLQKFRNTWPLASFKPIINDNGKRVWQGKSNESLKLEEDAVDDIELDYWKHWKEEVTKWSDPRDEDVKFWEKVCKDLNYNLSLPDTEAREQALVSRIFKLDSEDGKLLSEKL